MAGRMVVGVGLLERWRREWLRTRDMEQTAGVQRRAMRIRPPGLVTAAECAEAVQVPLSWLRRETTAGNIPCLLVGGRRRYDPDAVRRALKDRAQYNVHGQAV